MGIQLESQCKTSQRYLSCHPEFVHLFVHSFIRSSGRFEEETASSSSTISQKIGSTDTWRTPGPIHVILARPPLNTRRRGGVRHRTGRNPVQPLQVGHPWHHGIPVQPVVKVCAKSTTFREFDNWQNFEV